MWGSAGVLSQALLTTAQVPAQDTVPSQAERHSAGSTTTHH